MMLFASSALSALDSLKSLTDLVSGTKSKSDTTAFSLTADKAGTSTSSSSSTSSGSTVSPDTMRALLTLQAQNDHKSLSSRLFARLDSDGNGRVSKSEFDDALGKIGGASDQTSLFKSLDSDQDGAISQDELTKAIRQTARRNNTGLQPNGTAQDLFQRLVQQQAEMLATQQTGQTLSMAA